MVILDRRRIEKRNKESQAEAGYCGIEHVLWPDRGKEGKRDLYRLCLGIANGMSVARVRTCRYSK